MPRFPFVFTFVLSALAQSIAHSAPVSDPPGLTTSDATSLPSSAATLRSDERIIVEANINRRRVHFALDTGTGVPVALSQRSAENLGLTVTPPSPNFTPVPGEVAAGSTEPFSLFIFGNEYPRVQPLVVEMPDYLKDEFDGLLGFPAFKELVMLFDLPHRQIGPIGKAPKSWGWKKLRLPRGDTQLVLESKRRFSSKTESILIDTGSKSGISLSAPKWQAWRNAHPRAPATLDAYYKPAAGLVVREVALADTFDFYGVTLHNIWVTRSDSADVRRDGVEYSACLGIFALKQMGLVTDPKAGFAYLRAERPIPEVFPHNRLGAVFVPKSENDDLDAHVAPGTPADLQGIRTGDVLRKIDDLDVTFWRTDPAILPLARFWEKPAGTHYLLTLRREGRDFTLGVVLKDILVETARR
ncbi:MAG: hypothetical protein JWM32_1220 [Verrucomicrobia bacterium]|nr:hypothetical protein [Verrucomicrobiota bacterium]